MIEFEATIKIRNFVSDSYRKGLTDEELQENLRGWLLQWVEEPDGFNGELLEIPEIRLLEPDNEVVETVNGLLVALTERDSDG